MPGRKKPKSSQHYTSKTCGNYPTGGWCRWRGKCLNDGVECDNCFRESHVLVLLKDADAKKLEGSI